MPQICLSKIVNLIGHYGFVLHYRKAKSGVHSNTKKQAHIMIRKEGKNGICCSNITFVTSFLRPDVDEFLCKHKTITIANEYD